MAIPVGILEWNPTAGTKKVFPLNANGSPDSSANANYTTFHHSALATVDISGTEWQVAGYWDADEHMVLSVRSNGGSWTHYVYDGVAETPEISRTTPTDNHNGVNLAIDSGGIIHVAYDHHNTALKYRRSTVAVDSFAGTLTTTLSMLGSNESAVAYPMFFKDPLGVLYVSFRDGGSGNGDLFVYKYTVGTTSWAAVTGATSGKVIDGKNSTGQESPYVWGPAQFTSDWDGAGTGWMYLAFHWRSSSASTDSHDVAFVKWNGTDWKQMDGTAQTIPITTSNDAVVDPVAVNGGLNTSRFCIDSNNYPHLIYGKNLTSGRAVTSLWHTYWNGSAWSSPAPIWSPIATNTDHLGAGAPGADVVIDADDSIRAVFSAPSVGSLGMYALVSDPTWATWKMHILTLEDVITGVESSGTDVGASHDRYQWNENGIYQTLVPLTGDVLGATDLFPDDWSYYNEATISNPSSALTDPFFIIDGANLTAHFWANVQSDLGDVRLATTEGLPLPCYVHSYDYALNKAVIVGKWIGTLATSGTQKVRLYYGHATATNEPAAHVFGQYNVWKTELRACYMDGGGTSQTADDNTLTAQGSVTFGNAAGPFGSLLATDYNGTSQYGRKTTAVIVAQPAIAGIVAWGKSDSDANNQCVALVSDTAGNENYFGGFFAGTVASDPIQASARNVGAAVLASSASGYSTGTWHHAGFRFPSTTSRTAVLDGTEGTAETSSKSPTSLDSIVVGAHQASGASSAFFDGSLSLVQLYQLACPTVAELNWQKSQSNQATFWGTWVGSASNRRRFLLVGCG